MTEPESPAAPTTRKGPPRWFLIFCALAALALVGSIVEAMTPAESNDRAGAKQACVDEAGGQVLEAQYDNGEIFAVGQDDAGQTWTCRGTYAGDEWAISVRPGG